MFDFYELISITYNLLTITIRTALIDFHTAVFIDWRELACRVSEVVTWFENVRNRRSTFVCRTRDTPINKISKPDT